MALLRADQGPFGLILGLHHGYGGRCPAVLGLHRRHSGAELWIEVETVPVIALPGGKCDPLIACRCHYLLLHGQEDAHAIEIEILRPRLLHLLASTVEQPLQCQHLRTVQIQRLAHALKPFLRNRQSYLVLFNDFIHLDEHQFELARFPFEALTHLNFVLSHQH